MAELKIADLGRLSHAYLISAPDIRAALSCAGELAAAAVCTGEGKKPCGQCRACHKAAENIHPDVITLARLEDEKGRPKREIGVDQIRQLAADACIMPNEAERKVYIIREAETMNVPAQNAALKLLEEPPLGALFLLCTTNASQLLPTVRSRCVELKLLPLPEPVLLGQLKAEFPQAQKEALLAAVSRSGGYLGQARQLLEGGQSVSPQTEGFLQALETGDPVTLLQTLVPMEKWKRDALTETLNDWLALTEQALFCRSGVDTVSPFARRLAAAKTAREMNDLIPPLQKAIAYAQANVSPAAVCGYLEWELQKK